jgi:hypothetical protein
MASSATRALVSLRAVFAPPHEAMLDDAERVITRPFFGHATLDFCTV